MALQCTSTVQHGECSARPSTPQRISTSMTTVPPLKINVFRGDDDDDDDEDDDDDDDDDNDGNDDDDDNDDNDNDDGDDDDDDRDDDTQFPSQANADHTTANIQADRGDQTHEQYSNQTHQLCTCLHKCRQACLEVLTELSDHS